MRCGCLFRQERAKIEIRRRTRILSVALAIEHHELHPARHHAWLPIPARPPVTDRVLQRHQNTGSNAKFIGLVHKDGALLQDIPGVLQRDGNRHIEQPLTRGDDRCLRLVCVAMSLVEANTLVTFSDGNNATGEPLPVTQASRYARDLVTSGFPSS